jgi:prevent-host-death family protein
MAQGLTVHFGSDPPQPPPLGAWLMRHTPAMAQVSVRELRNHTADVLRRVEAGERFLITVDRRPVAELIPLPRRASWVSRERALASLTQADPGLGHDLAEALPGTIDDL